MDWEYVRENWEELKLKAREQWDKLTDDDLEHIEGDRERLSQRLRDHYGKSPDEINLEIQAWTARH